MTLFGFGNEATKLAVWNKGEVISGSDPALWRRDANRSVIRFSDYGDRSSEYGWEIDHIIPDALGGMNALSNLRPLHWRTNSGLGGILGAILKR